MHMLLGLVQTAESLRPPFPQVWPSNSFAVPGAASATKGKLLFAENLGSGKEKLLMLQLCCVAFVLAQTT